MDKVEIQNIEQKKKSSLIKWIITASFLLLATLPFHYVPERLMIFPKEHFTFSNTFIFESDISRLIERYNDASIFEQQAFNQESLVRKLKEKGLIFDIQQKKEKTIDNSIDLQENESVTETSVEVYNYDVTSEQTINFLAFAHSGTYCYKEVTEKDNNGESAYHLKFNVLNKNEIEGTLGYYPHYEVDSWVGKFKGNLNGDRISGIYDYEAEGETHQTPFTMYINLKHVKIIFKDETRNMAFNIKCDIPW